MSESWKNRFWSLLLLCTFALVLSVCNKAMDSSSGGSSSSSGGIAYADFKPSDISGIMICMYIWSVPETNSGNAYYYECDASNNDSSIIDNMTAKTSANNDKYLKYAISHDNAFNNGWRLSGAGGMGDGDSFHFYK